MLQVIKEEVNILKLDKNFGIFVVIWNLLVRIYIVKWGVANFLHIFINS